jgi:hypothetical protein
MLYWPHLVAHFRLIGARLPDEVLGVPGNAPWRPIMSETALAVMDRGEANKRILGKDEYRADFRRVEGASLKRKTALASAEGKRIFARCFYTLQINMYFVSILGRTKLPHESVEEIELAVRTKLEAAATQVNKAIDGAEALLKNNNIEVIASYDTVPLEIEVGITSALGRRYFELIHKLDQLMPLIQTLEIEEVISEKQAEQQRSIAKRLVLALASTARNLASGVRRCMNEIDLKKGTRKGHDLRSSRPDSYPIPVGAATAAENTFGDVGHLASVDASAGHAAGKTTAPEVCKEPEMSIEADAPREELPNG